MTEDTKNAKKVDAQLVEVPTQYGIGIKLPDGTIVDQQGAIVYLINRIEQIAKGVLG